MLNDAILLLHRQATVGSDLLDCLSFTGEQVALEAVWWRNGNRALQLDGHISALKSGSYMPAERVFYFHYLSVSF